MQAGVSLSLSNSSDPSNRKRKERAVDRLGKRSTIGLLIVTLRKLSLKRKSSSARFRYHFYCPFNRALYLRSPTITTSAARRKTFHSAHRNARARVYRIKCAIDPNHGTGRNGCVRTRYRRLQISPAPPRKSLARQSICAAVPSVYRGRNQFASRRQ